MWPFKKGVKDINKVTARIRQNLGEKDVTEVLEKLLLVGGVLKVETTTHWWGQVIYNIELKLDNFYCNQYNVLLLAKTFVDFREITFHAGKESFNIRTVLEWYEKERPDMFKRPATITIMKPQWDTAQFDPVTGTLVKTPGIVPLKFVVDKTEEDEEEV